MRAVPSTGSSLRPGQLFRKAGTRVLPEGSTRRGLAKVGLDTYREGRNSWRRYRSRFIDEVPSYQQWLDRARPDPSELEAIRSAVESSANRRRVVVVCLGGVDRTPLRQSIDAQLWPHVELIEMHDGWTWPATGIPAVDTGISGDDAGISGDDAGISGDDLVMVLRPGDRLEPHAAFRIADALWEQPHLDLVTFDDDAPAGDVIEPRFHPEWSPEILWSANYLGRSFAVRAARLEGVSSGGAGDELWWDLLLSLDPDPDRVRHIPEVLLHLDRRPEVAAASARELVARHLDSRGIRADAELHRDVPRLAWRCGDDPPKASVIVPTLHNRAMMEILLESLRLTDYPRWELIIVDNGGRLEGHEEWYQKMLEGLDATVLWWHEPFNFSVVNNRAAAQASGDVLVFCNDDCRIRSPDWLQELVGWATHEPIGTAGVQLIGPEGTIQHGGVVLGMSGFADHLFAGMRPGSDTLIGHTGWYRNTLANTAACVAVRREVFDEIGGFDERFELLGSDVALGLACHGRGYRNLTTPMIDIDHLESVTRGPAVPSRDMYASYWWYQRWLRVGDPYYSPNLSLTDPRIRLRAADEATPLERIAEPLGRSFGVFRQSAGEEESTMLADICRLDEADVEHIARSNADHAGYEPVRSATWLLPDIENPFYGGIATIFRIADELRVNHDVENRFVFWSGANELWMRSALAAVFPGLDEVPMYFTDGSPSDRLDRVPDTDVVIATQWPTAYMAARFPRAKRYAYLVQDFEPMFNPAGTMYALAEETYRLGFYALCNTTSMARFYSQDYGGMAMPFVPAVDTEVFHDSGRRRPRPGDPVRVFLYARPGHWRNCWELVSLALDELKSTYGDRMEIVTAGSWARPEDLGRGITHLGLLDYRGTGDLYRSVDIGISLTVSPHPSYLPLELMACGAAVVAFQLEPGGWILEADRTAVLVRRTVTGLVEGVSSLIEDETRRSAVAAGGTARIASAHSSWPKALARIHAMLSEPEAFAWRPPG